MFQCIIQQRNGWIHAPNPEFRDVFPGKCLNWFINCNFHRLHQNAGWVFQNSSPQVNGQIMLQIKRSFPRNFNLAFLFFHNILFRETHNLHILMLSNLKHILVNQAKITFGVELVTKSHKSCQLPDHLDLIKNYSFLVSLLATEYFLFCSWFFFFSFRIFQENS